MNHDWNLFDLLCKYTNEGSEGGDDHTDSVNLTNRLAYLSLKQLLEVYNGQNALIKNCSCSKQKAILAHTAALHMLFQAVRPFGCLPSVHCHFNRF